LTECKLCEAVFSDRTDLVEHLRTEHELLEVTSFVATVMVQEEDRERAGREFHRRFDDLKNQIVQR